MLQFTADFSKSTKLFKSHKIPNEAFDTRIKLEFWKHVGKYSRFWLCSDGVIVHVADDLFWCLCFVFFFSVQWLVRRSKSFEPTYLYTREKVIYLYFPSIIVIITFARLLLFSNLKMYYFCLFELILVSSTFLVACIPFFGNKVVHMVQGYFLLPEGAKSRHNIQTVNITIPAQHSCFGNRYVYWYGESTFWMWHVMFVDSCIKF